MKGMPDVQSLFALDPSKRPKRMTVTLTTGRLRGTTFVCLYDLDKFRGNVIIPALKVHPKVFFGGMLLENPYYVDPDDL